MLVDAVSRATLELPARAISWQPSSAGRAPAFVGECAIIADNQLAVYIAPSFSLISARKTCFWTLPVAVMGRADTTSRRSGSFCVATFCARR